MRKSSGWIPTLALALAFMVAAFITAACGGGSTSKTAAPAATPGEPIDMATVGELKGSVAIDGVPPANAVIRMLADPACNKQVQGEQTQETYVVGHDGKTLGNVFVYVKDGLGHYAYPPVTETVTLDQRQCRYHPHVFGIRVGQTLEILNSDPTLHNIHAIPKANTEFNTGQPLQGIKTPHVFTQREVMVPFKCDVHGWMNAYVGVLDHPYFAVTDADGTFDMKSLPPGTYTIEAWHEKLGTMTQSVTVGPKETKEIAFTFKVPA
jgi:plastocyanin